MKLISKIFRFLFHCLRYLFSFFRILKLKLLYPGLTIDFKTKIENNCSIICIKGGKLTILNSHISSGTQIIADENGVLEIHHSFIGRNCVITSKNKIIINKDCLIAEMVVIRDQDHILDISAGNSSREYFNAAPIEIKENVWIASKATVLKGVTIGKYSVVAASAVVTKEVPSYEVWGGIPAKFIKKIKSS
jgi:acetyltransferase-like isoleucine patch superfamily enzyme